MGIASGSIVSDGLPEPGAVADSFAGEYPGKYALKPAGKALLFILICTLAVCVLSSVLRRDASAKVIDSPPPKSKTLLEFVFKGIPIKFEREAR